MDFEGHRTKDDKRFAAERRPASFPSGSGGRWSRFEPYSIRRISFFSREMMRFSSREI